MSPRVSTWLPAAVLTVSAALPGRAGAQWLELDVPNRPEPDAARADAGRDVYEERCWFCHGDAGDGEGPVAPYLWPRPRDFTLGSYKLRTTESGELPTDEDLYRTITVGIPGTAMPEWGSVLSAEERWAVIAYVKTFADDLFEDEDFDPYQSIVEIGSPPDESADDLITAGRQLFDEADCWECHGALGRGDGERAHELTDDWDFPIWPADLHAGWRLKGGSTPRAVYVRMSTGLDGTPMPSYSETLTDEERWRVAYYVSSLAEPLARTRSSGVVITATRANGELPTDPADSAWDDAKEVWIPLTGQATFAPRWQVPAVTDLAVRVLYDGAAVALRLAWNDRFKDTTAVDSAAAYADGWEADDTYPTLFSDGDAAPHIHPDAAEVVLPVRYVGGPELPHFVYGNAGNPVDVWRWSADRQYGGDGTATLELRSAGVQRPPEPHATESQRTTGHGTWTDGQWTVVIRRSLSTDDARDVQLGPGRLVPIAFHVREGANGETGLKMSLSSWYFLHLHEPPPATSYLLVLVVVVAGVTLEYGFVRWMRRRADRGQLTQYGIPERIENR